MLDRLVLGDTLNYATTVAGYPASEGWTLSYRLVPRSGAGTAIEFSCSADTTDPEAHRAQVSAATTAAWAAGAYSWFSWVSKAAEKYSVSTGAITLVADPRSSSGPLDLRTEAEVALAQAKAALAAWTPTTRSYTIGQRSMTFNSTADIIPIIQYWEREVAKERRAAARASGLDTGRNVYVRLGRG